MRLFVQQTHEKKLIHTHTHTHTHKPTLLRFPHLIRPHCLTVATLALLSVSLWHEKKCFRKIKTRPTPTLPSRSERRKQTREQTRATQSPPPLLCVSTHTHTRAHTHTHTHTHKRRSRSLTFSQPACLFGHTLTHTHSLTHCRPALTHCALTLTHSSLSHSLTHSSLTLTLHSLFTLHSHSLSLTRHSHSLFSQGAWSSRKKVRSHVKKVRWVHIFRGRGGLQRSGVQKVFFWEHHVTNAKVHCNNVIQTFFEKKHSTLTHSEPTVLYSTETMFFETTFCEARRGRSSPTSKIPPHPPTVLLHAGLMKSLSNK